MPFQDDEVRMDLACGRDADDRRRRARLSVRIKAGALRRLGLHPDQPTSKITGPSPPGWWHAAAERAARTNAWNSAVG